MTLQCDGNLPMTSAPWLIAVVSEEVGVGWILLWLLCCQMTSDPWGRRAAPRWGLCDGSGPLPQLPSSWAFDWACISVCVCKSCTITKAKEDFVFLWAGRLIFKIGLPAGGEERSDDVFTEGPSGEGSWATAERWWPWTRRHPPRPDLVGTVWQHSLSWASVPGQATVCLGSWPSASIGIVSAPVWVSCLVDGCFQRPAPGQPPVGSRCRMKSHTVEPLGKGSSASFNCL